MRDFLEVDPRIGTRKDLEEALAYARHKGLTPLADLVAGHSAIDAPIVSKHPEWYRRKGGEVERPGAWDGDRWVEWGDLAKFDHDRGAATGLWDFLEEVGRNLLDLGFRGFRCDAAYQIPPDFWRRFIGAMRAHAEGKGYGGIVFFAENLGCSPEESRRTGEAGFDLLSSSAMWWDFESPWLKEEYDAIFPVAPLVSFPETHDTDRAMARAGGDGRAFEKTLYFTGLFGAGWMVPVGCEFGFTKRLDAVSTTPSDWEETNYDARDAIAKINEVARRNPRASFARAEWHREGEAFLLAKEASGERIELRIEGDGVSLRAGP